MIVGSFSYDGDSEDDIGMNISVIEEFIGNNPVPVYLGQKYTDKLKLQITLIKNPCIFPNLHFYEKDCRTILRILTGIRGYQWLKLTAQILNEDLWYKAKINSVSYKRVGGHVVGIILSLECDSCFAWSKEYSITIKVKANQPFYIYNNTDDLNNYVYPIVCILSSSSGTISITNISDNWTSEIKNVEVNEKLTIDSQHQILSSNQPHDLLLDDFNLGWFRLLPDKNEYICNTNITLSMRYRVPRKVGIVCEHDEFSDIKYNHILQNQKSNGMSSDNHSPISIYQIDSMFQDGFKSEQILQNYHEYGNYSENHLPVHIAQINSLFEDKK